MKNLIFALSILTAAANAQVHCVGEDTHHRVEITLSDAEGQLRQTFSGEARERDLSTGREEIAYFRAVTQPRTRASRLDYYSEDRLAHIGYGFSLGIRNETGYGSLVLNRSPLGNSYRGFAVECDRF